MSERISLSILWIVIAALTGGCGRTDNLSAPVTNPQATPATTQTAAKTIETEIVTTAPIAGGISATGKILVPEDRTAVIGPVNEGRIVRLYAGQGSRVRRGQKLAELESADIDQA